MVFVKDDHSYWKCDRCDCKLVDWPRYRLIEEGPLSSINQSPVVEDLCKMCADEIRAERKE